MFQPCLRVRQVQPSVSLGQHPDQTDRQLLALHVLRPHDGHHEGGEAGRVREVEGSPGLPQALHSLQSASSRQVEESLTEVILSLNIYYIEHLLH